jgi:diguanylate cyclase (GGDEF)-like protein
MLPEGLWRRRHSGVVALLFALSGGLGFFALIQGASPSTAVPGALAVAAFALLALWQRPPRKLRALAASAGLMTFCGVLVHLWEGQSEAHFAFFVALGVLALYQDWLAFLLALGFVVVFQGVFGMVDPSAVFSHPEAQEQPWKWALIHGGFILAASAALLASWRANEQIMREPLTGLPGRWVFTHRLETARAKRPDSQVAVLFVDLDRFKSLNDSRGHRAGDELLRAVAVRLRACVRPQDTVARVGGDEFAVLCEGLASPDAAVAIARRINQRLCLPYRLASEEASISASVGVAVSSPGQDAGSLISEADAAMYRAKHAGGDTCQLFDQRFRSELSAQYRTETELRQAIERGQIEAHYQPVVSLESGDVVGWEALARWRAEGGRCLMPGHFMPAAEASGLVVPMGEAILRQACAELAATREGFVAVNLSGRQLARPEFCGLVAEVLEQRGVDPARLCLEITETVLLEAAGTPVRTLSQLKRLGVQVALDDFGTGHSSLSHLRRLPLDIVKLDRSFIEELDDVGRDVAIVSAVLDMARSLGLRVAAEGVETEKQAACLRALDCELAQGFLFSAARPELAPLAPASD